jgi:WD40 repeat protein
MIGTTPVESNADALAFSADGRLLASRGRRSLVALRDARAGGELLRVPRQESPIYDLAFEPAGSHPAICGVEEQITAWDLAAVRARLKVLGIDWD